jgi:hypothetical protein
MERMAFQQASSGHQKTLYHSVPFNRALGIHGAGGVKPACRSQQWREEGSVKHQETNAEASHNPGSPNCANRCLRKVLRHTCSNSAKGSVKHSRLGKTRIPYPGNKAGRTERPISRKRRLARFRRTAVPNRRPITMPSITSENIPGQNCSRNAPALLFDTFNVTTSLEKKRHRSLPMRHELACLPKPPLLKLLEGRSRPVAPTITQMT